jgi:hypothetical protein
MPHTAHRFIVSSALAGAVLLPASVQAHGPAAANKPFTLAVFGDAPYGTTPTDTAEFDATPRFIDAVNADPSVQMVVHVGDIHSGKQYCTEAYDRSVADLWTRFADPLVYTPGDNEWTDCNKKAEGGGAYNAATGNIDYVLDAAGMPVDYASGDPVKNLDLIRSIFFKQPGLSLGARKLPLLSQAFFFDPRHPEDGDYVENVMWEQERVLFVTINLPGGSNNDQDIWYGAAAESTAQTAERDARTGADLRWLDAAFLMAQLSGAKGVVIVLQADMWDPEKGVEHQAGYGDFVRSIAENTQAFGRPVLLLNGDSHVYLSDNPLSAAGALNYMHPGYDVPNFHRIVVHGSTFPLEYLRLTIDPKQNAKNGADAFGPFSWTRVME